MWNLEKWYWWPCLQSRNRDTEIENKHLGSNGMNCMLCFESPPGRLLSRVTQSRTRLKWLGSSNRLPKPTEPVNDLKHTWPWPYFIRQSHWGEMPSQRRGLGHTGPYPDYFITVEVGLCQGPAPVDQGWFEGEMNRRGKTYLFINIRLD